MDFLKFLVTYLGEGKSMTGQSFASFQKQASPSTSNWQEIHLTGKSAKLSLPENIRLVITAPRCLLQRK
jgi:hypothetical protein